MSASFVIASNGRHYSIRKLQNIAQGIVSKRLSVSIFMPDLFKIITDKLTVITAARFMKDVKEQDLRKKILLDPNGYVLGGELAIVKALFRDSAKVRVLRFDSWETMEPAFTEEHIRKAIPVLIKQKDSICSQCY